MVRIVLRGYFDEPRSNLAHVSMENIQYGKLGGIKSFRAFHADCFECVLGGGGAAVWRRGEWMGLEYRIDKEVRWVG